MSASLVLIPSELHPQAPICLPEYALQEVFQLQYFFAENIRTARRFLRKINFPKPIADLQFFEYHKDTPWQDLEPALALLKQGHALGLLSEAGCPGIADPGAKLVAYCHQQNIEVKPLIGPSSLVLGLMAWGLNGQAFAFNGYLPIDKAARQKKLRLLEQRSKTEAQTQIFIETPYRNQQLFQDMLQTLHKTTQLGLAWELNGPEQNILSRTIAQWQQSPPPDLHKKPCVFGFLAQTSPS